MGKARMIDSREVKHKSAKLWLWIVWLAILVRLPLQVTSRARSQRARRICSAQSDHASSLAGATFG